MDAEMMQDEAMSMSNEQAIQILKPMRDMMRDQHGCPISDAYFAVDKAIHALQTISPDEVRGVGEWIEKEVYNIEDTTIEQMQSARCSSCGKYHTTPFSYYFSKYNYCPNCGAKMEVSEDA